MPKSHICLTRQKPTAGQKAQLSKATRPGLQAVQVGVPVVVSRKRPGLHLRAGKVAYREGALAHRAGSLRASREPQV